MQLQNADFRRVVPNSAASTSRRAAVGAPSSMRRVSQPGMARKKTTSISAWDHAGAFVPARPNYVLNAPEFQISGTERA